MGIIRDLFRTPQPIRLGITYDATPAPRRKLLTVDATPMASALGGLSWNPETGQGTERDPLEWEWLKYWFIIPDRAQFEALFRRDGLGKKLVELPASWCFQKGDESYSIKDTTKAARPLANRMRQLQVAAMFAEAHQAAAELGNAATWMQIEERGTFDINRQREPLNLHAVSGVRALQTLRKYEVCPVVWQHQIGEPIPLGEPLIYRVQLARNGGTYESFEVHASRLLIWRGTVVGPSPAVPASYGWGDDSVLLSALSALQSVGRSQRAMDRAMDTYRMLIAYGDLSPAGTDAPLTNGFRENWAKIRHMTAMGIFLADKGDKLTESDRIEQLDAPLAGLEGMSREAIRMFCAKTPFALPLLTGEFAGSLGGEDGQLGGWYGWIGTERSMRVTPHICTLANVLYAGSGIVDPDYSVQWAPVAYQDAVRVAQARLVTAQADAQYHEIGALSAEQIFRSRCQEGYQPELQPALPGEEPLQGAQEATGGVPAAVRREAQPGSAVAALARSVYQRDAAPSTLIALEIAPHPLLAQVCAILPDLDPETWPHLTLVYLGDLPDRSVGPVRRLTEASGPWPKELHPDEIGHLGDNGAVVIFVRAPGLRGGQDRLMRATAPHIRAEQFPRFIPHVTAGYLSRPITDTEQTALDALDLSPLTATSLVLRISETNRVTWRL